MSSLRVHKFVLLGGHAVSYIACKPLAWVALSVFLLSGNIFGSAAKASPIAPASTAGQNNSTKGIGWTNASSKTALNLASTSTNLSASHLVNNSPVTITVGGSRLSIGTNSLLTPAERIAVTEVIQGGTQTLQIGALGNATGGSFTVSPALAQHISSLIIPTSVNAILNFGNQSSVSFAGSITDNGALYAFTNNSTVNSLSISAANISVGAHGVLSTVIPQTGLAGVAGAIGNESLILNAGSSILNAGTISSASNLSLNAGLSSSPALLAAASNSANSIINTGTIKTISPAALTLNGSSQSPSLVLNASQNIVNSGIISGAGSVSLSAAGAINNKSTASIIASDVSLTANSGVFNNQGTITARGGNINVSTASASNLNFDNTGGTLEASFGSINFGDQICGLANGSPGITLQGGDLISNSVNFSRPAGAVVVDANSISGQVNVTGASAVVHVLSGALDINSLNVDGDPILSSTKSVSLNISSSVDYDDLIIYSGGDISITGPVGGATIATNLGGSPNGDWATVAAGVTFSGRNITGASATGGSINMSNINISAPSARVFLQADKGTTSSTGGNITVGNIFTDGAHGNNGATGSKGSGGSNGGSIIINAAGTASWNLLSANGGQGGNGGDGSSGGNGSNGSTGGSGYSAGAGSGGTGGTAGSAAGNGGSGGSGGSITVNAASMSGGLSTVALLRELLAMVALAVLPVAELTAGMAGMAALAAMEAILLYLEALLR